MRRYGGQGNEERKGDFDQERTLRKEKAAHNERGESKAQERREPKKQQQSEVEIVEHGD